MKEIPLTKGLVALVDDEDFDKINQFNWYAHQGTTNKTHYALRTVYKPSKHVVRMHKFIMNTDAEIDHKDGNGLNNQKTNLRIATRSQNASNFHMPQGAFGSGYRGVKPTKSNRYEARISDGYGGQEYLGTFDTPQEAALAYNEAAIRLKGEFATLNEV